MIVMPGIMRARSIPFSPLTLFSGGRSGAWYDPSDISTLFQDDAGTTPVTASGQTVGRMLDKSGNGNHLSQTTSTNRPAYVESGSLRYLVFDGVNDHFTLTSMGAPTTFTSVHGVKRANATTARGLSLGTAGSNGPTTGFMFDTSGTFLGGHGAALNFTRVTATATDQNTVLTGVWVSEWNTSKIRFDGADQSITSLGVGAASVFNAYARRGSVYGAQNDFGCVFVEAELTQAELSLTESWMAAKQGRTI